MAVLSILETEEQAEYILKYMNAVGMDVSFVAMTPYVVHFCTEHNIPYIDPHANLTQDQIEAYRVAADKCVLVTKSVIDEFYKSRDINHDFMFEIGSYCYFNIYIILGCFYYKAMLLDHILKTYTPCEVLVFESSESTAFLGYRQPIFNQWSIMLKGSEWAEKIKITTVNDTCSLSGGRVESLVKKMKEGFKNLISKSVIFSTYAALSIDKNIVISYRLKKKIFEKKILFLGGLKNWAPIIPFLRYKVSVFRVDLAANRYSATPNCERSYDLGALIAKSNFSKYNITCTINTITFLCDAMYEFAVQNHMKLNRFVQKYSAICASVLSEPVHAYLMHLAKYNKVPTCIYQHGEMNLYPESLMSEASELQYLDYYFCFGAGVQAKYENASLKSKLKNTYVVGSSIMQNLAEKNREKGSRILYSTGKYQLNNTVIDKGFGCDVRLYEAQAKLFGYFKLLKNTRNEEIIFKPNNTAGLSAVPFAVDSSCVDSGGCSFVELLDSAKLVILDAPATTCIEACCTNIPLFVLLNRVKWFEKPKQLLKKRAVVCMTPEDLIEAVDAYLSTGIYPADLSNREFVELYAVADQENPAVCTVPRIIESIVERTVDGITNAPETSCNS